MNVETKCSLTQEEKEQYISLLKQQANWQLEVQLDNAQRDRQYASGEERAVLDWIVDTLMEELGRRNRW